MENLRELCFLILWIQVALTTECTAGLHSPFTRIRRETCSPKLNLVFLKVHKCGSSTVGNIVIRKGLRHNLNFGLPKFDKGHIGWPDSVLKEHILLPSDGQINMISHHMVYNRTTLNSVMSQDTVYIAIIREPFSHFKSVMSYFNEISQLGFKSRDWVYEFLSNPDKYERPVKLKFGSRTSEHSFTRNFLSSEFGIKETDFINSPNSVDQVIDEFDLVMLMEYFYESVILLRRLLCWEIQDMLFITLNTHAHERPAFENIQRQIHKDWSLVDHYLYEYANRTFWHNIAQQTSDFYDEVEHFRNINERVQAFCSQALKNPTRSSFIQIQASSWNEEIIVDSVTCREMNRKPADAYDDIINRMYSWPGRFWIALYHGFLGFM